MHQNMPEVNLENTVFFLQETKQLHWVNYLRVLAIVFIVGFHMLYTVTGSLKYSYGFFGALLESGTMTFVFISGFLFQYRRNKDFCYKKYILRRFQIVFLPYRIATTLLLAWTFIKAHAVNWHEMRRFPTPDWAFIFIIIPCWGYSPSVVGTVAGDLPMSRWRFSIFCSVRCFASVC